MKNFQVYSKSNGNINELAKLVNKDEDIVSKMMDEAEAIRPYAHNKYSNVQVACSILTKSGRFIRGVNVENVAYGSTICAERSAICSSISTFGEKDFEIYLVHSNLDNFLTPCGSCRQCMAEFGNAHIILMNNKRECKYTTLEYLLPESCEIDFPVKK